MLSVYSIVSPKVRDLKVKAITYRRFRIYCIEKIGIKEFIKGFFFNFPQHHFKKDERQRHKYIPQSMCTASWQMCLFYRVWWRLFIFFFLSWPENCGFSSYMTACRVFWIGNYQCWNLYDLNKCWSAGVERRYISETFIQLVGPSFWFA